MALKVVANAQELLESAEEAVLEVEGKRVARKLKSGAVLLPSDYAQNFATARVTDEILITVLAKGIPYYRVQNFAEVLSKKSVEKIMDGDAHLAKVLGVEFTDADLEAITRYKALRERLAEAVTPVRDRGNLEGYREELEQYMVARGHTNNARSYADAILAWKQGTGTRTAADGYRSYVYAQEPTTNTNPRFLRVKGAVINSSGDYSLSQTTAREIWDAAKPVWDNTVPSVTLNVRRGSHGNRAVVITEHGVRIECQYFPRLEVLSIADQLGWE